MDDQQKGALVRRLHDGCDNFEFETAVVGADEQQPAISTVGGHRLALDCRQDVQCVSPADAVSTCCLSPPDLHYLDSV
jgi:hypothetical protein